MLENLTEEQYEQWEAENKQFLALVREVENTFRYKYVFSWKDVKDPVREGRAPNPMNEFWLEKDLEEWLRQAWNAGKDFQKHESTPANR